VRLRLGGGEALADPAQVDRSTLFDAGGAGVEVDVDCRARAPPAQGGGRARAQLLE